MTCSELDRELTAYLAGELDELSARAARGHLRTCAACRARAEDHARIRDELAGLGGARPEPPPAMWDAIWTRLGEAEIGDARQSRWARWWQRARPHLVPAGLAVGACAAAAVVIHLRRAPSSEPTRPSLAVTAPTVAPPAPVDDVAPAPPVRPTRDATDELADEAARLEARYRTTVAELLPVARAEVEGWKPARARAFKVELARREGATVRAPAGRARDRAWHELISFLELAALGERVADAR